MEAWQRMILATTDPAQPKRTQTLTADYADTRGFQLTVSRRESKENERLQENR
jgi:hypothetical protein